MLKLLIPIFDRHGAAEAARHSAFLFAEHCVSEVEVVEVLGDASIDRSSAFWSPAELRERYHRSMSDALARTCAILDDAGVPYTRRSVFGPPARSIAACVECASADIVVVDASRLGFLRKWGMLAQLRRLCAAPVTLLQ
ncbi:MULTISPECIES: universal stress protein [Paraburkholderia]|uniref:Universal stress protein family protein n=1 Tax=Paraburkholderia tropica TaxID=92647 RepID=A0A1A5XIM6_9BURK|nr:MULTISPECIES: universal stress protein [Paraburkholderia]MBB2981071.1 hypothetical protein [Paraburkholderia tropica]MBB3002110.1 hypothetical protein [Paraburkholderia tropica]MBB6321493.1 hypothetical protein [Paraburkholderia tropica]MDE1138610.1 universal stress protein [Paraburkholderia tropica]OBR52958.1 universal stress protein [Paraburkholderia tropica]